MTYWGGGICERHLGTLTLVIMVWALFSIIGVASSALPCFVVNIPRHLLTSKDTDFGNNGVGFAFSGVSLNSFANTSRMETSMSSKLLLENNNRLVCSYIIKCL